MDHDLDQRYLATDPASELHFILWTLGVTDAVRREIVLRAFTPVVGERGREHLCTNDDSTN